MQGSKKDTDVKNRLLHYVGEGKGVMIWENSLGKCILPYVKEMTRASLMFEAGNSKLVLWDNPEGWGGEGGGGGGVQGWGAHVHPWVIHVDVWKKPPQYCEEIILQLKEINYYYF